MTRLDKRLSAIMKLVRPGSVVADIGCDHGYLICELVKSGCAIRGFACDANSKPLERAKKAIEENCLSNSIDTVLTNGLSDLPYRLIDTFIIAGMGGDLIAEILLTHTWTRDSRFHFILQPMTKPENLRRAIFENGFSISYEKAISSANIVYTVMSVNYTGRICTTAILDCYTGMLLETGDLESRLYLTQVIRHLEKKAEGFLKSKTPENAKEYIELATQIRERMA